MTLLILNGFPNVHSQGSEGNGVGISQEQTTLGMGVQPNGVVVTPAQNKTNIAAAQAAKQSIFPLTHGTGAVV